MYMYTLLKEYRAMFINSLKRYPKHQKTIFESIYSKNSKQRHLVEMYETVGLDFDYLQNTK